MSEFSEAYFLKANNVQEAEQLLKNSGLEGYISEEAHNGWVVILPNKESFEPCNEIIENNKGILLHYQYSEDGGLFFALYKENREISSYENSFDGMVYNDEDLNLDDLISTLGLSDKEADEIKKIFEDVSEAFEEDDDDFEESCDLIENLRCKFMEVLKITPDEYEWMSYHYASLEDDGISIKLKKVIF